MATWGLFGMLFMLLAALVAADTTFITPPQPGDNGDFTQNPTYKLGDEVDLNWNSALEHVSIQMWRAYPPMLDSEGPVGILGNAVVNKKPWTVDVAWPKDFARTEPAVYFFSLYETGNTDPDANSHYFNVTDPKAKAAATTTTSSTATKPSADQHSATSQPDKTADDSNSGGSHGLSKGGKIGLAVGCTVGGIIVLGSIAFVAYWTKRHRKERQLYGPADTDAAELEGDEEQSGEHNEKASRSYLDPKRGDNEVREIHEVP